MNKAKAKKPHILLVIARGEAIRNFVFSDFLKELNKLSTISILSSIANDEIIDHSSPYVKQIIPLKKYKENSFLVFFREIIHTAHFKWNWTDAAKYYWHRHNKRVEGKLKEKIKLLAWRILGLPFANRKGLYVTTIIERWFSWVLRPTKDFDKLFDQIKPDIVFNCSHVHGVDADLPMKIASSMGFKTGTFIFSWDNLFTRSRIFPKYDFFFTWHNEMRSHLFKLYRNEINFDDIYVTGTPQFDFHFNRRYYWDKKTLYQNIGLKISRPYILYTTGMHPVFLEEDKMVNAIIDIIKKIKKSNRPQLVVRTYIKGNSNEMIALSEKYQNDDDVIFPTIMWDKNWKMPLFEDLFIYTNLLRYTSLGINAASTVSIELMIHNKPIINLGFEPPNSSLPDWTRFSQHVDYEHYRPLVKSKGIVVAKSLEELEYSILRSLNHPKYLEDHQKLFLETLFNGSLDRFSARRIGKVLNQKAIQNEK